MCIFSIECLHGRTVRRLSNIVRIFIHTWKQSSKKQNSQMCTLSKIVSPERRLIQAWKNAHDSRTSCVHEMSIFMQYMRKERISPANCVEKRFPRMAIANATWRYTQKTNHTCALTVASASNLKRATKYISTTNIWQIEVRLLCEMWRRVRQCEKFEYAYESSRRRRQSRRRQPRPRQPRPSRRQPRPSRRRPWRRRPRQQHECAITWEIHYQNLSQFQPGRNF